jgi:hypothetical protein
MSYETLKSNAMSWTRRIWERASGLLSNGRSLMRPGTILLVFAILATIATILSSHLAARWFGLVLLSGATIAVFLHASRRDELQVAGEDNNAG